MPNNPSSSKLRASSKVSVISSRHVELPLILSGRPMPVVYIGRSRFFANYNITLDITKFRSLIGETLRNISNLVLNPSNENKYKNIKRYVISAYDKRDKARLRRLLRSHAMRDKKPTAYLHRLQALAENQCGNAIVRSLFLEQLPELI